jgi:hypothetical protein
MFDLAHIALFWLGIVNTLVFRLSKLDLWSLCILECPFVIGIETLVQD